MELVTMYEAKEILNLSMGKVRQLAKDRGWQKFKKRRDKKHYIQAKEIYIEKLGKNCVDGFYDWAKQFVAIEEKHIAQFLQITPNGLDLCEIKRKFSAQHQNKIIFNEFYKWAGKFATVQGKDITQFLQTIPKNLNFYEIKCKFSEQYQNKIAFCYTLEVEIGIVKNLCIERFNNSKVFDGQGTGYGYSERIGSGYGDGFGIGFGHCLRSRFRFCYSSYSTNIPFSAYGCCFHCGYGYGNGYKEGAYGNGNYSAYFQDYFYYGKWAISTKVAKTLYSQIYGMGEGHGCYGLFIRGNNRDQGVGSY